MDSKPRVNKAFLFSFMLLMATSTIPFGYGVAVIGPNIEVLEAKFGLNDT